MHKPSVECKLSGGDGEGVVQAAIWQSGKPENYILQLLVAVSHHLVCISSISSTNRCLIQYYYFLYICPTNPTLPCRTLQSKSRCFMNKWGSLINWEKIQLQNWWQPEQVTHFTKLYITYKIVNSFFCVHSISKCDEQKVLNLELVLFHLKHKASSQQQTITDSLWKKSIAN